MKYDDKILVSKYEVLSPYDKRDFVLPSPKTDYPKAYSWKRALPVLNQGKTDHCTAFSALAMAFGNGNATSKFKQNYNENYAHSLAKSQIYNANSWWTKKFLKRELWKTGGRHPRATLKELYKGFTYNGLTIKLKGYFRIPLQKEYEKWIYEYGGLYVGVAFNRKDLNSNGVLENKGNFPKKLGHQVWVSGYDEKYYYAVNSWGNKWGDNGILKIRKKDYNLMREVWAVPSKYIDFYEEDPKPFINLYQNL